MRTREVLQFGLAMTICLCGLVPAAWTGCSEDRHPVAPDAASEEIPFPVEGSKLPAAAGTIVHASSASTPPADLVTVSFGDASLELWPYTGGSFDGTPSDPVNVIFAGQADPLQIRAALLALNGDRTAFGLPDVYPFNAVWSDAIGDVQTTYAGDEGWSANYVQLQLGAYEPVRAHLRLFETASPFGHGVWTVGAAHFEILIPGTADHQVIQWELAEQLVTIDMLRCGLLDPNLPMVPSGPINAAPTFREIPAILYNGLPPELQALILGPGAPPQVGDPVGIPTNGQATLFQLVTAAAPATGSWEQSFTLTYQQVVPKPFCNDGTQFVLVTGPVSFEKRAQILPSGRYEDHSRYQGTLTITPWDISNNQPAGVPYPAEVGGMQNGAAFGHRWSAQAKDIRSAERQGGGDFIITSLQVSAGGPKRYREQFRCQDQS